MRRLVVKKIVLCIVFVVGITVTSFIVYSITNGNNIKNDSSNITELTDFTILTDCDEKFQVDNEWQLYVLDENVTEEIPVILVTENETVWKVVPLVAVLKELGVEVSWKNENTAILINKDNKLYLDLITQTIHYENEDFNLLKAPVGGKYYYEFVNKEVVVSSSCMGVIARFLGLHICCDVKSKENVVEISFVEEDR